MTTRASKQVADRRTAAQRVREALAAQQEAMTAGVDAAMKAYAARQAAEAAADKADDDLRAAVDTLAQQGQTMEAIAALTDVPLGDVRATRRPKRGDEDGDDQPPAPVVSTRSRRSRRGEDDGPTIDGEPVPDHEQGGDQGEPQGDQPSTDEPGAAST